MLSNLTLLLIKRPFPQTYEHAVFQKKRHAHDLYIKKMFKIIQNNNNTNKNVNENFTELPFLNHHITEFLCCGQHTLLSRLWEKRLAHTLMVRIQNGTIFWWVPQGNVKIFSNTAHADNTDSILLFWNPTQSHPEQKYKMIHLKG